MAFERDPKKLFPHDHLLRYTVIPLIPSFVSPNMITVFRLLCIPVVLAFLLAGNYSVGVPFFVFVAFTDALDGTLARLRHQITDWGTFYDPVADKLLIGSVILFVVFQHLHPLLGFLIVFIELAIIWGGFHRRRKGLHTSANIFGKTKMFLQVVGVTIVLISLWAGSTTLIPFAVGTLCAAILFAVLSLLTYGL
jgi:CDP-diacylglycerol--glycerol-3-phosphate 3-phosphatidyltransferase